MSETFRIQIICYCGVYFIKALGDNYTDLYWSWCQLY